MRKKEIRPSTLFAALALVLLVLFVLVIPVVLETGQRSNSNEALKARVAISSWPVWPEQIPDASSSRPPPDLRAVYVQMAEFANRSAYPMSMVERAITDARAGRASSNDLYLAARAAANAAMDERDALMGLVLPESLHGDADVESAWRSAQLAALAKVRALEALENPSDAQSWEQPEYLGALKEAGERTVDALNSLTLAVQRLSHVRAAG